MNLTQQLLKHLTLPKGWPSGRWHPSVSRVGVDEQYGTTVPVPYGTVRTHVSLSLGGRYSPDLVTKALGEGLVLS